MMSDGFELWAPQSSFLAHRLDVMSLLDTRPIAAEFSSLVCKKLAVESAPAPGY